MKKIFITILLLLITCSFASDTLKVSFKLNHEADMKQYKFIYSDNLNSAQDAPYEDGMTWNPAWIANFIWNHDSLAQFMNADSEVTIPIGIFYWNNKYIQAAIIAEDEAGNKSAVAASNVYFKQDTTAPSMVQYSQGQVKVHR